VRKDSPIGTLTVAAVLCLVCSVAVAGAAVLLRPAQERNKALTLKREILKVAGLQTQGEEVDAVFNRSVQARLVDLATGEYVQGVDPGGYDQREAARDPKRSTAVPPAQDLARIKRRSHYAPVYLVSAGEGPRLVVLPVHGYGLWSTMYGLLALAADGRTIRGLTFIVLGRAEAFAMKNRPWPSFLDSIGQGLGYSLILVLVGTIRELLGAGSLLGVEVLPTVRNGGWYEPNGLMLLAPGAFFLIGLLIWLVRTWKPRHVERPEYRIQVVHRTEAI